MSSRLVEVHPRELKFTLDEKKHSSCVIHLSNLSDHHVAFKVKTTSPKRYFVCPVISILKPNSTCDIKVTIPAQGSTPTDIISKDKFLIQSAVVSSWTREEEITRQVFTNGSGKYVEERKLKVVLASPPHSPVLQPMNGAPNQEASSMPKEQVFGGAENLPPRASGLPSASDVEFQSLGQVFSVKPGKDARSVTEKNVEGDKPELSGDTTELIAELRSVDSKLIKAERLVSRLKDEKNTADQEKERLQQELATLRSKDGVRRVRVGFPPLFLCAVMLIGLIVGYTCSPGEAVRHEGASFL